MSLKEAIWQMKRLSQKLERNNIPGAFILRAEDALRKVGEAL